MQQEMKYIYQVYLDGSFSKAAEHLYLTQPALSMSVQKIESALGMPIFDRGTRPLSLTQAGEVYIETVRQTMFLEQELEQQIEDIRNLHTGTLCIGGSHYLNAYILPPVLTGFNREYPGIRLELVEDSSARLSQMLSNRELDLTFNCDPKFLQNFKRYPAFYDHILLAVPKEYKINSTLSDAALSTEDIIKGTHLDQACPMVELIQFKELEFLLLAAGNNLHDRGLQLFQEAGFEPKVKMELSQLVTAYHLAEDSLAATFVSDRLVTAENKQAITSWILSLQSGCSISCCRGGSIPRLRFEPLFSFSQIICCKYYCGYIFYLTATFSTKKSSALFHFAAFQNGRWIL